MPTICSEDLRSWCVSVVNRWGASEDVCELLADTLVEANLRGIDSHGVIRLPAYGARIEAGLVDLAAEVSVEVDGAVVRVDANGAPGQVATMAAARALVEAARQTGVATALVRGSAHFGTAGYYARYLAQQGLVAIVVSNSEPIVVPYGGRVPLLGTNPLAFAAPGVRHPICLDMATSNVAAGKIALAQAQGQSIPADWGTDEEGNPTTDPAAVEYLLPLGGAKGYGLAMMIEILAGVLTGAGFASSLGNMYRDFSKPQNIGHWLLAIDPSKAAGSVDFAARITELDQLTRDTAPLDRERPVLLPGDPEETMRTTRLETGIPLADTVLAQLDELAKEANLPCLRRMP